MPSALTDELSRMTDKELVEIQGGIGDPDYREMVLAEERRRTSDKAVMQARRSNWIAIGSLAVATASLIVSVLTALR
ncbi:MAG: hypothetical protein H6905_01570 [Hyphomicrobiales bacterium]|nr:hypothetical protein [Hyphomicrobiales bacterium]